MSGNQQGIRIWMEEVRDHLRELAEGEVEVYPGFGVCSALNDFAGEFSHKVSSKLCRSWPKFSGDQSYPIPSLGGLSNFYAYTYCHDKWADDAYGDLRREYCDYLADCIDECLEVM